jgi:hypothetical protein
MLGSGFLSAMFYCNDVMVAFRAEVILLEFRFNLPYMLELHIS